MYINVMCHLLANHGLSGRYEKAVSPTTASINIGHACTKPRAKEAFPIKPKCAPSWTAQRECHQACGSNW